MRWDAVSAPHEKLALARALVDVTSRRNWSLGALQEASEAACGDAGAWRGAFPGGAHDAVWFISEVSDASMAAIFKNAPAHDLKTVIVERLAQNRDLKPFVRRVMVFDFLHPVQAVARMNRTARVMLGCLTAQSRRPHAWMLNLAYTLVVFIWLFDRSDADASSHRAAERLMWIIGG